MINQLIGRNGLRAVSITADGWVVDGSELQSEIDSLEAQIGKLSKQAGPQGKQGIPGPPGPSIGGSVPYATMAKFGGF